jgi:hypothetical protein
MAKSKTAPRAKKVSRSAKKPAAKKPAARKKPAAKKEPALSSEARRKLLKLRTNSESIIEQVLRLWEAKRTLKVPGLTPARFARLLAQTRRAAQRETIQRELLEARLAPLQDARLRAEDAAYRALLDVHAAVKLYSRADPALGDDFAFLLEHLRGERNERAPEEPDAPQPA